MASKILKNRAKQKAERISGLLSSIDNLSTSIDFLLMILK